MLVAVLRFLLECSLFASSWVQTSALLTALICLSHPLQRAESTATYGLALALSQVATLASLCARALLLRRRYLATQFLIAGIVHAALLSHCRCASSLAGVYALSRAAAAAAVQFIGGDGAKLAWRLYTRVCAATCDVNRHAQALD